MKTLSLVLAILATTTLTVTGCASGDASPEQTGDSAQAYGYERLYITDNDCGSHEVSSFSFQNVGNRDFNEGAPNFVALRLCQSGGASTSYRLVPSGSCYGHALGTVGFQNVGRNDTGEGAPSYVSMTLCSESSWESNYTLTEDGSCPGSAVTFRNVGREDEGEGAPTYVTVALCRRH